MSDKRSYAVLSCCLVTVQDVLPLLFKSLLGTSHLVPTKRSMVIHVPSNATVQSFNPLHSTPQRSMHPTELFQTLGVSPLPSSNPHGTPCYPSLHQLANPFSCYTPHMVPAGPTLTDTRARPKKTKKSKNSDPRAVERFRTLHPST